MPALRFLLALLAVLAAAPARAVPAASTDPFQHELYAYGNSGDGWTGADGAYSVPLPDGRTAWLFSDTFLGEVRPDGSRPRSAPLIHNSIVVESDDGFETVIGSNAFGQPDAVADTPDGVASWYWMGDGTVEAGELRAFLFHFVPAPGPLVFQQIGVALARFSLPDLELIEIRLLPAAFVSGAAGGPVSYGSAILERDDHTYVYGVEDLRADKFLHVARAPAGDLLGAWEYWTGEEWSPLPTTAIRLLGGVANELSVTPWDDVYLLVAQDHAIGPDILAYRALDPWGPFEDGRVIFTTPETGGNILTYNAKAHPARGPPGALLVSYNVNSVEFGDVFRDVDSYRPRFVDVWLE